MRIRARRRLFEFIIAGAVGVTAHAAWAVDPGNAQGTLWRDGHATVLNHAQTFRFRDLAALGAHANRSPELRILLSAREIPSALLQEVDLKQLERFAQREQVPSVVITTVPNAEGDVKGQLMAMPAAPGIPLYTVYELPRMTLSARDNRLTGSLVFDDARADFSLKAVFSTPDFSEAPPRQNLFGDTARASAPVLAYLEFERLLKTQDFAAARLHVTSTLLPQILDLEHRASDPAFATQFTARLPATAERRAQITQVAVYDDRAYIVVRQRRTSLTTMRREKAVWRVDD